MNSDPQPGGRKRYCIHITDPWAAPGAGSCAGSDEWVYRAAYPFYGTEGETVARAEKAVRASREGNGPYLAPVECRLWSSAAIFQTASRQASFHDPENSPDRELFMRPTFDLSPYQEYPAPMFGERRDKSILLSPPPRFFHKKGLARGPL